MVASLCHVTRLRLIAHQRVQLASVLRPHSCSCASLSVLNVLSEKASARSDGRKPVEEARSFNTFGVETAEASESTLALWSLKFPIYRTLVMTFINVVKASTLTPTKARVSNVTRNRSPSDTPSLERVLFSPTEPNDSLFVPRRLPRTDTSPHLKLLVVGRRCGTCALLEHDQRLDSSQANTRRSCYQSTVLIQPSC